MSVEPNAIDVTLWQAIREVVAEIMSANPEQENASERSFDWPALSLFFLLATAFWIPPMPHSMWSLPMMLRICWLTVLLSASYIVLFRRKREATS
jgi:hypothetical protein